MKEKIGITLTPEEIDKVKKIMKENDYANFSHCIGVVIRKFKLKEDEN